MPAERPAVASKRFVMIWNCEMASCEKRGWPKLDPTESCDACRPSSVIWNLPVSASPCEVPPGPETGEFPNAFALMPGTRVESSM